MQNLTGVTPAQATSAIESNGQVGNLQLRSQQEADLVDMLKILSDGYTKPNPVSPVRFLFLGRRVVDFSQIVD